MTPEFTSNRPAMSMLVPAVAFAAIFWLLDAGSMLWSSNSDWLVAFLPQGSDFANRLVYAAVFAVAGSIAGAAVQRSRDIEVFALDKLKEGERKYEALLASSFDSVITLDSEARIVEMSESAAGLLNLAGITGVGRSIDEFLMPAAGDNDKSPGEGNEALRTEASDGRGTARTTAGNDAPSGFGASLISRREARDAAIPVMARTASGRSFPAEVRITRILAHSSSAILLALRETTSSVVAQKALRHSERRYQALFDNIPDGVYRSLPDGRLLAANPAMVKLLGFESMDALLQNGNTRDLYVDPQKRGKLLSKLDSEGVARNIELDLRRRDGSTVTVLANIRAVTSENNEDVIYEGSLTDITDLLAAREALERSEEHFRALCEHSLDIINVIDKDGSIIYSSPSSKAVTGLSPEDQVGLKLFRAVHEDDIAEVQLIIRQGFERPGTPHRFTCRVWRRDGGLRYLEAVGTAFLAGDGELRAVIHSRDITERIETERELRDMQKMQVVGRMTKGLAHEFNNLLTVISGNLELLGDELDDLPGRPHLDTAIDACRQGSDLTRRLVAFAATENAAPERLNVNGALMDVESVLRRSLSETIELQTDYGDELWDVRVDPRQFEAAILQLAVNAKDAMSDEGRLTIRTRNVRASNADDPLDGLGDAICICVSDNGRGMNEETLQRATEPFFSTAGDAGHSGLGLSVVKRFVEAAGGRLELSSKAGAGTTVRILLPRTAPGEQTGDAENICRGDETVLVVDDNADVRAATAALVRSLGYQVREAGSAQAALGMLGDVSVDLLFTDLAMPRISGLQLAEEAASLQPGLKILLTSGNEAAFTEANDGLATTYELIRKPFRKRRLAERLRHALDEKS